jgi:hypothetical protein
MTLVEWLVAAWDFHPPTSDPINPLGVRAEALAKA